MTESETAETIAREAVFRDLLREAEHRETYRSLKELVREGHVSLSEVGGFTAAELDGAYACAAAYINRDRCYDALQVLGWLLLVDPQDARHHSLAGLAMHRLEQFDLADHYYRVALTLGGDDAVTLMYAGETKLALGHLEEGSSLLTRGIELASIETELAPYAARAQTFVDSLTPGEPT